MIGLIALLLVLGVAASSIGAQGEHTPQANAQAGTRPKVKTHDDLQPATLPPLPAGVTIAEIVRGDGIYHGKGNCFACHGVEAEGRPAAGDALTVSLNWAQCDWRSIDSLIDAGIPQTLTRSPIMMPPRGGRSNLTDAEVASVAKYVWAISQTRGEPWPGGHASHEAMTPAGADEGMATGLATQPTLPSAQAARRAAARGKP
jgi:mono/diheme cytochrome c family protein